MLGKDPREVVAVFVGGGIGAVVRAALGKALETQPGTWPWATFIVNMVGAFLLGYFSTRLLERLPASSYRRPFLGTGLCGGLTTFSTMQVEIVKIFEDGYLALGIGYASASIVGGLVVLHVATAMVRRVAVRL